MAIDTRAKRQSAAWVGYPGAPSILPSGTIDGFARAQIAWTYAGIAITPPIIVALRLLALMGVGS